MYKLQMIDGKLSLIDPENKAIKPFTIDFSSAATNYRRQHSSIRSEAIAKAVGLNKYSQPIDVIDATAGFGADALILTTLGCKVRMIERCPQVIQLLEDALNRNKALKYIKNMSLIPGDAISILSSLSAAQYPDVVYLDPMFPQPKKSAKAKLAMQILRELTVKAPKINNNYDDLFEIACKVAKKRVVVKRHKANETLTDVKPSFSITGKTIRFDVYSLQ